MDEKRYSCEQVVPVEQEPRHHLVIENEFVRAFAVEIAPHDRTLCHRHAHDYLMYVACIADIVSAPRDQVPETHLYHDEECVLAPAGMTHVVENLIDTKFRNIVLEFLPKARDLRRGPQPKPRGGKILRIRQRFNDAETAAVYVMSMQGKAEVEIYGPAIVASPYEYQVELEELGGGIAKLNNFNDLAWIGPLGNGLVCNTGSKPARIITFQVGCSEEQGLSVSTQVQKPVKSLRAHADEPE